MERRIVLLIIMLQIATSLKIIEIQTYRDGGSMEITTNKGVFWLDNRIFTETKGKLFSKYPSDKEAEIISDTAILNPLKEELNKIDVVVNW